MSKYIPTMYQKSIFDIDYKKLYQKNIKCILFDLDNTIIPANISTCDDKIIELFDNIKKENIKPIIFSNSPKMRISKIAHVLKVDYVYFALKPLSFKFYKTLKKYNLKKEDVAIIGDQILTDIVGGNKVGITTILTDQISEYDSIFTKFNRYREKKIIKKINLKKGNYYEM